MKFDPTRHPRFVVASLLLVLFACTHPFAFREQRELSKAEELWKSRIITSYRFEMRTSCFCPTEMIDWAVVEVQDGAIVSVKSLAGSPLSGVGRTSRKTVDELFAAAKPPYANWVGSLDFDFDPQLGYPLKLVLEGKKNIADAGVAYEARNLSAM